MNKEELKEEIKQLKKELKIADDRWKRAEAHHREYHESLTETCVAGVEAERERCVEVVKKHRCFEVSVGDSIPACDCLEAIAQVIKTPK